MPVYLIMRRSMEKRYVLMQKYLSRSLIDGSGCGYQVWVL